ncbi:RNA-binding protein [Paenibacillus oceani]|uniref:Uncharacterized protein n=1 Tax=Paenibacillus oceani TaxID=2772510 RepID=A0A927H3V7_9BACL|nr:hypothetical protein [Paenibacillus oceani]MBD2866717.1 hypothetical protein [Paenibacillus oceani]
MDPKTQIMRYLQTLKKQHASLPELEQLFVGQPCTYEQFSGAVLELEAAGMLQMVQRQPEGITIWHTLNERVLAKFGCPAVPALPFYRACLDKSFVYGKDNQRSKEESIRRFGDYFTSEEQARIEALLAEGGYYPQEIVRTEELGAIWRNASWNT